MAFTESLRGSVSWSKSQTLTQRKQQVRQKLAALLPSTWEEVEAMQLRGVGYERALSELARREISLSVLEEHLETADPDAYERIQAARRKKARAPGGGEVWRGRALALSARALC